MRFFQKTYKIFYYPTVDSTNCTATALYNPGQILPIIIAEQQTRGRGTHGKQWYSPKGNLYFSFIIEQNFSTLQFGQLSLLIGLAIRQVLQNIFPNTNVLCKWPNDVLLNGKKISGVLIEKAFYQQNVYFIIGIGLNIQHSFTSSTFPSTSLHAEGLVKNDGYRLEEWVKKIMVQFDSMYEQWGIQGFDNWFQQWNGCCYGWEKKVVLQERAIQGMFQGIDSIGHLLVQTSEKLHRLASGSLIYFDEKV